MLMPTRKGCCFSSVGLSEIRTGTRWTTLIQLPEAFWAGISEKAEPASDIHENTASYQQDLAAADAAAQAIIRANSGRE
jgi:hypothetical protein